MHAGAVAAAASRAAVNEPDFVRLSSGAKLPMLGFGTFNIDSPAPIKWVPC